MKILINCSNLVAGGSLQVADSVCTKLREYPEHDFIVVLSSKLNMTGEYLNNDPKPNIIVYNYDMTKTLKLMVLGREHFLDKLVSKYNIDIVLTIFGPSYWIPKCKHLSGFARGHMVLNKKNYLGLKWTDLWFYKFLKFYFKRSAKYYFTENEEVSFNLKRILGNTCVRTITNYYNQIYDNQNRWIKHELPKFNGVTLLTISAPYPHKNLPIILEITQYMKGKYPGFNFRFVVTISSDKFPEIPEQLQENILLIGSVDVTECPSLYQQADIMFMPTLIECFTATYPEAMRMEVPIVTTDLEFARGLCGDAALYYSPFSYQDAAEKIYLLVNDKKLSEHLVVEGKKQLGKFDNYDQRMKKLMDYMNDIINN